MKHYNGALECMFFMFFFLIYLLLENYYTYIKGWNLGEIEVGCVPVKNWGKKLIGKYFTKLQ